MEIRVLKFGGTSVGSVERIKSVAERVRKEVQENGRSIVLAVSAMSGETNKLIELGKQVGGEYFSEREYDQLVASGEQVSSALVSVALHKLGVKAKSFLGLQVPIRTQKAGGLSIISDIDPTAMLEFLKEGGVPVIAGFQGVSEDGDITTLGRGGSDTTAVALAAALGSCRCVILTDVDGVYSAHPSIVKKAKKLNYVSYEEMLELAAGGAKVLQTRCVSLARKYKVPLEVGLSFEDVPGTLIVESYDNMEDTVVSGISHRVDEAKLTVRDVPNRSGVAAKILRALGDVGIVIDMIVQSEGKDGKASISFTLPEGEVEKARDCLAPLLSSDLEGATVDIDTNIAKVSVVGEGMRTHSGVAAEVFEVLGKEGINIDMITTSEIKISVAIEQKYVELAVRALHEAFVK